VKPFLAWVMLVVIFDGATCAAFRAMLNPPPVLTLETATPVPCGQSMKQIDPNVAVGMSNDQLQQLQDELCATQVSQPNMGRPAQPADVLEARELCPQLDTRVHQGMTLDELRDLQDQLCP
jgi:hypothetical protein